MPRATTDETPWRLLVAAVGVVLVVDQLTKWWAVNALADRSIDIVWTLRLHLVFNPGSAFSIGGGSAWGPFVSALGLVIIGVLVWQARRTSSRAGALALGLLVGGAMGNLLDRAFREGDGFMGGEVVDFVDFQWWPVFNVADAALVVGGVMLVITSLLAPEEMIDEDDDDDADEAADA